MRFGNFLLNHRICSSFFLSGSDHFFICVFPKVTILIMIMGWGGGGGGLGVGYVNIKF